MSSVAADIVAYLDALIAEPAGTTLFEGSQPESPDSLIAVTQYGGEAAEDRIMGPSLTAPGAEISLIQVLVRNTSIATAKTKADAIHALLDNYDGTLSGRAYFQIESINGMPFSIGQDANARWRWVCNFRVQHSR